MKSIKNLVDYNFPTIKISDVGAMATTDNKRYSKLLENDDANVIGFEPDDYQYSKLVKSNKNKRIKYLKYFLGDGTEKNFYITRYPGCSSLLEPNGDLINLFSTISTKENGNFYVKKVEKVKTKKMDEINDVFGTDLLKVDTQGSELEILSSFVNNIKNTLVIETEVEFVEIYKNQPLFADIDIFLRKNGFILHKLIDIGGRPISPFIKKNDPAHPFSQLLWADAIYVKDFINLKNYSDNELLKASYILHDVYDSYDLCFLLLKEYSERKKLSLNEQYAKNLALNKFEIKFMNLKTEIDSEKSEN